MENQETPTIDFDTFSLAQLVEIAMQVRAKEKAMSAAHKAEITPLTEGLEGLEALILARLPADETSTKIPYNGGSVTVGRKVKTQFRINEGQSDLFYDYVKAENKTELLTRALKQTAIEEEVKLSGGQLPPGLYVHTEVALSMTEKKAPPKST